MAVGKSAASINSGSLNVRHHASPHTLHRQRRLLPLLELRQGDDRMHQFAGRSEADVLLGDAVIVDVADEGQIDLGIGRLGFHHRLRQHHRRVIGVRRERLQGAGAERFDIAHLPARTARHLLQWLAAFSTDDAVDRCPSQLGQFAGANTVPAHELTLDAELLHLTQHRTGLGIGASIENQRRMISFDLGENRTEVGGVVAGEFAVDDAQAVLLGISSKYLGDALSIGGAVIDHGDSLEVQGVRRVLRQSGADGVIIGQHAEEGLETLLRDFRIGGGRCDLRDAGPVVDARGRIGAARVQMADDAVDLFVDELLRHHRGLLGVGLIVLSVVRPQHRFAVDLGVLGIEGLDREDHAVDRVLPIGGLRPGERPCGADGDHRGRRSRWHCCCGREQDGEHTTMQSVQGGTPIRELRSKGRLKMSGLSYSQHRLRKVSDTAPRRHIQKKPFHQIRHVERNVRSASGPLCSPHDRRRPEGRTHHGPGARGVGWTVRAALLAAPARHRGKRPDRSLRRHTGSQEGGVALLHVHAGQLGKAFRECRCRVRARGARNARDPGMLGHHRRCGLPAENLHARSDSL